MEKDAIIKIIYQMKKYAKKKIEKRAKLAAKKAEAAKKNKKFGTRNRSNTVKMEKPQPLALKKE